MFSSRHREGPRNIISHCSPFRETADRPATASGDSKKHREGGRLHNSSRLWGEPKHNNNSTSRRSRGGCNRPASARDDVDRAKQAI